MSEGGSDRMLLAVPTKDQLLSLLRYLLDEKEFLSPHGIRSLSKVHQVRARFYYRTLLRIALFRVISRYFTFPLHSCLLTLHLSSFVYRVSIYSFLSPLHSCLLTLHLASFVFTACHFTTSFPLFTPSMTLEFRSFTLALLRSLSRFVTSHQTVDNSASTSFMADFLVYHCSFIFHRSYIFSVVSRIYVFIF